MTEDSNKSTSDPDVEKSSNKLNQPNGCSFEEAFELTGHGRFNHVVLFTSGLIMLNVSMESVGMSYAVTAAECELKLNNVHKGLINAAAFIGIISTSFLWGYLGDRLGRRAVMLPAILLSAFFSLCSSFSTNVWMLLVLRFLTGCLDQPCHCVKDIRCACNNEFKDVDVTDFQKIVELKESGLVIYRHKIEIGNFDDQICDNMIDQESAIETNDNVFIVHNTSDEELKHADIMQALDEIKISCKRCSSIYEHAKKLLLKIPSLSKNGVIRICPHCCFKSLSQETCSKCKEAVKMFLSMKDQQSRNNKNRFNTWLHKVNHLLDNIIIDETPKNISRAHSTICINDLRQTPSETTCDQKSQLYRSNTDVTGSLPKNGLETKNVIKPNKERPTRKSIPIREEAKYKVHHMRDKYDIRYFDEKPTQKKKYATKKYYNTDVSKQDLVQKSSMKSLAQKSSTHDTKKSFSKQTLNSKQSKVKILFKSSKHPKKIQSDETIITTLSRVKSKCSQKDLVYFFPKSKGKYDVQTKNYPSSSTLIKKTQEQLKALEELKADKKKINREQIIGFLAIKKENTPISTATFTTMPSKSAKVNKVQNENFREIQNITKGNGKIKQLSDQKLHEKKINAIILEDLITPESTINKQQANEEDDFTTNLKKLQNDRSQKKEQELKIQKDQSKKSKYAEGKGDQKMKEVAIDKIKITTSINQLMLLMGNDTKKEIVKIPVVGSDITMALEQRGIPYDGSYLSTNTDVIESKEKRGKVIMGERIINWKPFMADKASEPKFLPTLFHTMMTNYESVPNTYVDTNVFSSKGKTTNLPMSEGTGIIKYALSDRTFIEKGWTMLPTEKVVRRGKRFYRIHTVLVLLLLDTPLWTARRTFSEADRLLIADHYQSTSRFITRNLSPMNIYRMRPAHPELNWFENNKHKEPALYDTGEKLSAFTDNGHGQWYYRNGRLALDYYDAEELNAQQRFVVYSSGEPDDRGRRYPITVLAAFDYLGNGVVFDHTGKIRLKYNQTEGVVLDRGIGPVTHWKWHALNDPPVLQQVMIDTETADKDPKITKLGPPEQQLRTENEEMLAIEFENFVKEKKKKLAQDYKPFQIRMKALKINSYFSLKVLDQSTVYLIFRDGSTTLKLNICMLLDHHEIVDTDTADLGEVSNNIERLPIRSNSLELLRKTVHFAQRHDKTCAQRYRKLRIPSPSSADKLTAASSRPLRCPLQTMATPQKCYCNRKPSTKNIYYDTRII